MLFRRTPLVGWAHRYVAYRPDLPLSGRSWARRQDHGPGSAGRPPPRTSRRRVCPWTGCTPVTAFGILF